MSPALTWSLQRLVVAPLAIVLTVWLWATLPLTLIVAGVMSAFVPGWLRPLRLLWVAVLHLTLETLVLLAAFGLWIASGFGALLHRPWFERVHYRLMRWYLVVFFREARRVLRLKIETVGPTPDAFPGQPLLVLCRHAGVGDSFSIMYALMHWYHREPRIVLKAMLAWDPALGVMLSRLPSTFIAKGRGRGRDLVAEIGVLASGLDENDAFVIFPEGGNFTPRRRRRAIDRLRGSGREVMAQQAEAMAHVLAPQPGGVLAALDAAPSADVLLVAHTGLDHLDSVGSIWRELPMDKRLLMGWWRVPRAEIPLDRTARIEWLFDRWGRIDAWIAENQPQDLAPRRG
ncbi:1-acyl-sn-glycerol-3-phosphate acyltransferase [Nocardioides humi]|uniref:Phospholipid/glycerol acyltransferase domain-containing protein n=1 Tax=Nocardioides humi TaxID=449461 RepID=A0ABN2BGV4_9ACTN|nr:1-acyl-sn-glycerol-3-phosphate acyltransferase [Nocardioides humi]